jgi:uncharacterized membrane protein
MWVLIFRATLFLAALCLYFADRQKLDFTTTPRADIGGGVLCLFWIMLAFGMISRIVDNQGVALNVRTHKGALLSALAWIILNGVIFAALFIFDMINPASAAVLMFAYAVCDKICVLYFCPFRVFFMRNRSCAECRIYYWDYVMICTPLIIFPHPYSISLLVLSAAVLLRWETSVHRKDK